MGANTQKTLHHYAYNRDIKQLHKLVSDLTLSIKENPLPIGRSNNELAEEFAHFIRSKIHQICGSLEGCEKFSPQQHHSASKLSGFMPNNRVRCSHYHKSMASKSCEIDLIPTTLLKDI